MASLLPDARLTRSIRIAALLRAWTVVGMLSLLSLPLRGQELSDAAVTLRSPATVQGRVVTQRSQMEQAISGAMVTVHRVGADSSGALDSARTDASGRYLVDYTRFGDESAVYFAAVIHSGIAYFSTPLRGARVAGDDGIISVFDTTSRGVALHVQGHHVVVSAPASDGSRNVVEVWEISNDTTVTLVARDSLSAVWSVALPRGATKFAPGEGDVGASSIVSRDARVLLIAPFGPGVKQFSYSYLLPPTRFPLFIPIEQGTGILEVLLEEQSARATGAELRAVEPVVTQGRRFQRFLAQDVHAAERLRITVPTVTADRRTVMLMVLASLIGVAMLAALLRAFTRRTDGQPAAVVPHADAPDTLLAMIAALDARHERGDPTLDPVRYAVDRAALKARVAAALSRQQRAQ